MSKSYCAKLWNHQYVHMSGTYRFCCATTSEIKGQNNRSFHIAKDHPANVWNSPKLMETRLKMMAGETIPECQKCVEQESRGYKSMREEENKEDFFSKTNIDGSLQILPSTMELHFGNQCNLKCKMCSQNYSNQIGKEIIQIGKSDNDFLSWVKKESGNVNNWTDNLTVEYNWFKNKDVNDKLMQYVSNHITDLAIVGGEPTIIPEFWQLFDYCDQQQKLSEKNITITTNLTNTNPRMMDWLPRLKSWTIWASMDGIGAVNEYIRYPSNFSQIEKNLQFYKSLLERHGNGRIVFSPAIQLLNIHQLDDMLKYFIDFAGDNFTKNVFVSWMAQVWYPKICNYDIAPFSYRKQIADKLKESIKIFEPYENCALNYENQIKNLEQEGSDEDSLIHMKNFIRYNDTQDRFRGVKHTWRQLLPDLDKALTKSLS
jgi:MoaA/NifB/PqqE/SkfB family radical SAM enzyme